MRPADHPLALDTNHGRTVRQGWWALLLFGLGFGLWAFWAPLDEALPVGGWVVVESHRKAIQHPYGGVVETIAVQDGQRVRQGQTLLVLNKVQNEAQYNATDAQRVTVLAQVVRLQAELHAATALVFPESLVRRGQQDPAVAQVLASQQQLFTTRQRALQGELRIVEESAKGLAQQVKAMEQLQADRAQQEALQVEQLASVRRLHTDGFVSRTNLLDVERQLSQLRSQQSEDAANLAGVRTRLTEMQMRGEQIKADRRKDVETQLVDLRLNAAILDEKQVAVGDQLNRAVLVAPVDGMVMGSTVHTVGGVVKGGETLMEVVPSGDTLVVHARIPPQAIDRVAIGQGVQVHLENQLNQVDAPTFKGQVVSVAADAATDPRTGEPYYLLKATLAGAPTPSKAGGLTLQAGMRVTVMVQLGERTLAEYLYAPLTRRVRSAFIER